MVGLAYLFGQTRVLFEELNDAVGELRMVDAERFDFMQRQENFDEEMLVLFFQRQRKAVDDAERRGKIWPVSWGRMIFWVQGTHGGVKDARSPSQNLEQLGDAIVPLGLVDETVKRGVDLLPNVGP